MARFEMADGATLGEANADVFYELGMMYSIGHSVPIDFVSAHKWFNLAATHGHSDAARLRREIAAEMSSRQIADSTANRGADGNGRRSSRS